MTYLWAVLAGIAAAIVGWLVTGAITAWVAGWAGMSDFEGGRGMFAFLVVGPLGGLFAMIGAAWLTLRLAKGKSSAATAFTRLGLVLVAIAALTAASVLLRLYTIDVYTNRLPPTLEFELRVRALEPPPPAELRVELHTNKNVDEAQLAADWVASDGLQLLSGTVALAFKTTSRLLVVSLADQRQWLFELRLSRDPGATADMGPWQRPNFLAIGDEQPQPAPAEAPIEVRYRVQRLDGE